MATSGTATLTAGLGGQLKVEAVFNVDLDAGGLTASDFVITLDTTFANTPKMLAIPALGTDQTFTLSYVSGGPSIDLAVTSGTITTFDSTTIPVIIVAYDQP